MLYNEEGTFQCGHPRSRENILVYYGRARCRTCGKERCRARRLFGPASTPAYQEWKRSLTQAA
jgi:hypothetical protein